ncbi:hypothetical protein JCGZ_22453 [Jatropha curcas]|uniref:N-acetyltransferase domain-containing protein n=1 Tax=Jatropha curcas TaxID=180498 RepID=A0A067JQS9_JATCU|nr:uncharacterized protein LOC105645062 isoform X3 [Jatropha curcas]KDP26207.1 hypothetical protein JCGZ_22453 [Jatropha curcas]
MAPKKNSSSSSPIPIGNCEVIVDANKFTCKSEPNSLQISVTKSAKIKISVREELNRRSTDDIWQSKPEGEGRTSTFGDDYMFVLVNSKDSNSRTKSYLQEVLRIYTRELPTMNYAANTGKQSMFLEKCVSSGKYCSLLLESKSIEGSGEIIAVITYQIVPADTQYAEIPLAAVSSIYQHKGFGRFLYMELKKRLCNIGVRAIYCWGDKESEGFWLKQGFESIAEVDNKGRVRRLPIKADIRRALCFPGGSILMVSHLNEDTSAHYAEPLTFNFPLKPHKKSSSVADVSIQPWENYDTLSSENQIICRNISYPEGLITDGFPGEDTNLGGFSLDRNCEELAPLDGQECSKMTTGAELEKIGIDFDVKCCSCYTQGTKKRAWEASLSSLMSKKVKGSHQTDCGTDSVVGIDSESDRIDCCINRCSLGISKSNLFVGVTPEVPFTGNCMENNAKESRSINMASEAIISKELQSKGETRIMLMNIANGNKKLHLTKVIETLGGGVTPDGSVSTHVVTGKVRKTLNFCTALCSGAWIVSSSWLKESFREGKFVDESPYILNDEEYKLKYRTELKDAVSRAKARPRALLRGSNICITTHVQPPVETLSAIVRSAGGNVISGLDKVNEASNTIFVACEEDMEEALSAAKKGIQTFSSDWLMNCIMRQELDLQALQFAESL